MPAQSISSCHKSDSAPNSRRQSAAGIVGENRPRSTCLTPELDTQLKNRGQSDPSLPGKQSPLHKSSLQGSKHGSNSPLGITGEAAELPEPIGLSSSEDESSDKPSSPYSTVNRPSSPFAQITKSPVGKRREGERRDGSLSPFEKVSKSPVPSQGGNRSAGRTPEPSSSNVPDSKASVPYSRAIKSPVEKQGRDEMVDRAPAPASSAPNAKSAVVKDDVVVQTRPAAAPPTARKPARQPAAAAAASSAVSAPPPVSRPPQDMAEVRLEEAADELKVLH